MFVAEIEVTGDDYEDPLVDVGTTARTYGAILRCLSFLRDCKRLREIKIVVFFCEGLQP
jgi:hypothetical protein